VPRTDLGPLFEQPYFSVFLTDLLHGFQAQTIQQTQPLVQRRQNLRCQSPNISEGVCCNAVAWWGSSAGKRLFSR